MYVEYLFIILDYLSTLNRKIFIYEWGIPILLGCTSGYLYVYQEINLYLFVAESITFIATLLGFTLATLTLFLTNNSHLEKIKQLDSRKKVRGQPISLYRLLVINYSYLIIIESILCISFYIGKLFSPICIGEFSMTLNCIYITITFHILFMTIRSITDLYFVVSREK